MSEEKDKIYIAGEDLFEGDAVKIEKDGRVYKMDSKVYTTDELIDMRLKNGYKVKYSNN